MTVVEVLEGQMRRAGEQFAAVLGGLAAEEAEFRIHGRAMRIREQVVHLCECYQALSPRRRAARTSG